MILIDLNDFNFINYTICLYAITVTICLVTAASWFVFVQESGSFGENYPKIWLVNIGLSILAIVFMYFAFTAVTIKSRVYDTITKKYVTEENIEYIKQTQKLSRDDAIKYIYNNVYDQLDQVDVIHKK